MKHAPEWVRTSDHWSEVQCAICGLPRPPLDFLIDMCSVMVHKSKMFFFPLQLYRETGIPGANWLPPVWDRTWHTTQQQQEMMSYIMCCHLVTVFIISLIHQSNQSINFYFKIHAYITHLHDVPATWWLDISSH